MDPSQTLLGLPLRDWDHLAKALALLAALVFFAYKVASGFMVTNMSLKLACARHARVPGLSCSPLNQGPRAVPVLRDVR